MFYSAVEKKAWPVEESRGSGSDNGSDDSVDEPSTESTESPVLLFSWWLYCCYLVATISRID